MSLEEALEADRSGDLVAAAQKYEQLCATGDPPLEAVLNLALLYWQATDPGLAASARLDPQFLSVAGRRYPELLEEAETRFPHSTAARFWRRYVGWTDLGAKQISEDECRRMLSEDPDELVPALQLFVASGGRDAAAEAHELLRRSRDAGTTGARYVVSVLESVLTQMESR